MTVLLGAFPFQPNGLTAASTQRGAVRGACYSALRFSLEATSSAHGRGTKTHTS